MQGAIQQLERSFDAANACCLRKRASKHSKESAATGDSNVVGANIRASPEPSDTSPLGKEPMAMTNCQDPSVTVASPA